MNILSKEILGVLKIIFDIQRWEDIKEKIGILEFFIYPKMFDKS